jgi:5-methylcytosine-specific restriction endonuclease McrA
MENSWGNCPSCNRQKKSSIVIDQGLNLERRNEKYEVYENSWKGRRDSIAAK